MARVCFPPHLPSISLASSVHTNNNLQAKANAKLKRKLSSSQDLTSNIIEEVNKRQPSLVVHLKATMDQAAIQSHIKIPRGKPLSKSYKNFLLSIAFSPVKGVMNLCRLFNVGVMRIHESTAACAMLLHTLQLGYHV